MSPSIISKVFLNFSPLSVDKSFMGILSAFILPPCSFQLAALAEILNLAKIKINFALDRNH
jgi:hypothetical protein